MVTNFWYNPFLSALWIVSVIAVAIGVSLIYKGRIFCRYLYPITAPLAVIARTSPLEVRSKAMATNLPYTSLNSKIQSKKGFTLLPVINTSTSKPTISRGLDSECKYCKTRDCYKGNKETEGCPWGQHPAAMMGNSACSMCMKCTHSCPYGEPVRLLLRKPFSELANIFRPDCFEVFIVFSLLGLYSFYNWSTIVDVFYIGFHDNLVLATYSIFPFLTADAVEEYMVGYFAAIGIGLGLYSFASVVSSRLSRMRFKINFSNFGYAYLTIFVLHFLLTYSIVYLGNLGQYINIALSKIGINLYIPPNFLVDYTQPVFGIGNSEVSYESLLKGIPICLAIPIGGYISYRIAKKMTKTNSVYRSLMV